jgi:phosphomannomutase/phosphoglucomutase
VELVDGDRIASRRYRVLVDPANSVGALTAPRVLRRLGVKTYTLNGHLDPMFPGREPEPTVDSLAATARTAVALGIDIAVGFDGDADRAIFIDEKGGVHWGDRSGALLASYLAQKFPNLPRRVYTGVSSSILVEEYLKALGIQVVWMKVGSVDISRRLKEEGGLCGFEENGGFMNPVHHPVRDASATLALMLDFMSEEHVPASALFDRLPSYYPVKTKIPMSRERALEALERVKEAYSHERMITIDGVKIIGEDYWVLVRPSGTEPVLRIMAEARSREKAEKIVGEVMRLVVGGAA